MSMGGYPFIHPWDIPTRAEAEADERGWDYTECLDCGEIAIDPSRTCRACGYALPDAGELDQDE